MTEFPRSVRSFVIRAARLTPSQRLALDELYPVYGLPFPWTGQPLDYFPGFERLVVEIGFGNGDATLEIARQHPQTAFLGVEVHPPGVGHLLRGIADQGLTNLRILRHDAVEVVAQLAPASIDAFHVFFPDPWPKKKHHKRRLLQADFLAALARALKPGGAFYFASDWEEYAEQVAQTAAAQAFWHNPYPGWATDLAWRPTTRFEARGLKEHRPIRELYLLKRS